ncbi:MAG: allophanate hydrolase [Burkholderiaceae bacterium]
MSVDGNVLPFTIETLHQAYADGTTAAEVVDEVFARIARVADPGIFIALHPRAALHEQIASLGPFDPVAKPLWGIPFAVKDNIDVAGLPTTAACPAFAYEPREDAAAVALLRAAGALVIGKTNLDQFATGLVGMRTPYPVPRNALDPRWVPGGSSSGSAVAVAHGIVSFSLGTDTAGSGRVPAALNNLVGLKPSLGLVSTRGVVPACRTLDTVSIFALAVGDARRVLSACARFDAHDPFSRAMAWTPETPDTFRARIGIPDVAGLGPLDPADRDAFDRAVATLQAGGALVRPFDLTPFHAVASLLYHGAWVAERHSVIASLLADNPDAVHPVTRSIVSRAEDISATDAFRDLYRLRELARECADHLEELDALCVPSIPAPLTVADYEADPVGSNDRLGTYTNFVNLLDLCGIAVPVQGFSGERPPASVTILARAGQDGLASALAGRLQRALAGPPGATDWKPHHVREHSAASPGAGGAALAARATGPVDEAPVAGPACPPVATDELALAVVGAHMSGMPLNGELTDRGGRLLVRTRTAAEYRLYALAGGPPQRPGLVRDAGGAPIDIEIWAMPRSAIGDFLAGVPSPLGLGRLTLSDGSEVPGFICEPHGLAGAREVTSYGGWRAYLASRA